jgi:hypothetical protein
LRCDRRVGAIATVLLVSLAAGCGGSHGTGATVIPVTVLEKNGPGHSVPVFASTSLAQLKALLVIAGSVSPYCPTTETPVANCWPNVTPPSASLLVALPTPGGLGPGPVLTATLSGSSLILQQSYPTSDPGSGSSGAPAVIELAAIPLDALPKTVISVVAPPWNGPVWYGGAALVDLRDPLPTDTDLTATVASLISARDKAIADANARLSLRNAQYVVIDRVGVVRWDDDSLACPGVTASSHAPVAGYILFMVQAGVPVSRELEYHLAGDREVFCGYSH